MELYNNTFVCFDGSYDYYLEKRDMILEQRFGTQTKNLSGSSKNSATASSQEQTGSRQSWENSKKQQAAQRKLENELKKTEEEINRLEARNEELDNLMQLPENASSPSRLLELSKEQDENNANLEKLMEQWETLSTAIDSFSYDQQR